MTRPIRVVGALRAFARRFAEARAGVAAIEFAFVLPVMLVLFIGMSQITVALSMDRKVTLLGRTAADLVGRVGTVTTADVQGIMRAASVVLEPYDDTEVSIVLSSVVVRDPAGPDPMAAWVCWSRANANGTARAANSDVPIPAGFDQDGSSFILAEVRMPYRPIFSMDNLFTTIDLWDETVWPVRNTTQVELSGVAPC
ncbi:TadE/TadG family type IV pilus assembly protein [Salinarimonas rosea]|uniref:TadE/TadG family type IV pilus assembly protein n=1 Tax=Salinarimonas rosea TaxID=552063 RepID=UPI00040CC4AC|nr:TadE/TadG family type IV pilus assembly protein [Salinarimonas rosea]